MTLGKSIIRGIDWEKVFPNDMSDYELVARIY